MKRKFINYLIIIGMLILNACSIKSTESVEKMPGIDIPISELNIKVVILSFPGNPPAYKNEDSPTFLIKNRSRNEIVFAKDFGVKIFKKQDTLWVPVTDKMRYSEGDNLLKINDIDPTGLGLAVFPEMVDLKSPTIVRVVVIGHLKDRPTEKVGAFIDVQYNP